MPQNRTFSRPSLGLDVGGVSLPDSNGLRRINDLKQSLSGIVASRSVSSERGASPRYDYNRNTITINEGGVKLCESESSKSVAERFLLTSQRRVEELMGENHRLELLCMTQEDDLKKLRTEIALYKQEQQQQQPQQQEQKPCDSADNLIEVRRRRLNTCKTPSLSRRSKGLSSATEEDRRVGSEASVNTSFCNGFESTVRKLVRDAISLFPELNVFASESPNAANNEWESARDVLLFIHNHLADWSCLTSELKGLGTTTTVLSQTLSDVEMNQYSWHTTLLDLIKRLQFAQNRQKEKVRAKDNHIQELRREIDLLNNDIACAIADRDRFSCRCEDLERALCRQVEDQATQRKELERLRRESDELRNETNLLRPSMPLCSHDHSTGLSGTTPIPEGDGNRDDRNRIIMNDSTRGLEEGIETNGSGLREMNSSTHFIDKEKEHLTQHVKELQEHLEQLQKELDMVKRFSSNSSSLTDAAVCELNRPRFLPPLVLLNLNDTKLPDTNIDLSSIITSLDTDVFAIKDKNEIVKSNGLFFHIGYSIANNLSLFKDCSLNSVSAWEFFLLQLQSTFTDTIFYNADHAADNAQFFYALLFHSGLIPYMSRLELTAAVTTALCMECRYSSVSACFLSALQDPDAAGTHSCILLEKLCLDALNEMMTQKNFEFIEEIEVHENKLFLDTVKGLLLPPNGSFGIDSFIQSILIELNKGPLRLEDPIVRQQLVRLLLLLSRDAFTMRPFAISKVWAEKRYHALQEEARLAKEHNLYGFDISSLLCSSIADAQLQLIELKVLPLCRVMLLVFPSLQPCLLTLQANMQLWLQQSKVFQNVHIHFDRLQYFFTLPDAFEVYDKDNKQDSATHGAVSLLVKDEKSDGENSSFPATQSQVKRGSIVVSTEGFLAFQKEMLSVYNENISLRQSLEELLRTVESATVHTDSTA
ncbi:uncharacterized protein TM35_000411530 [Trypanosoma theileri]|uniref:PDEase domain-containing protein n=1 Tax=Trypanosoma theileri TaxID=67003 RepID=A0A1X0NK01_9TRYP|nr:uncharacterized protein TM35_000411530 [Trypanosoma theileri]ORC84783.1 hypothetical protein TM35_000411530 [Trypanosoma theileri]